MRTSVFLSALYLGNFINPTVKSNAFEIGFFAVAFVLFIFMDIVEFLNNLTK